MNKLYKKLPLQKNCPKHPALTPSFVIARRKERDGNTTYINL